jgi:hypothetical protein
VGPGNPRPLAEAEFSPLIHGRTLFQCLVVRSGSELAVEGSESKLQFLSDGQKFSYYFVSQ